jgi:glycerol-3-phosphate dehydrogenase
VTVVGGKLTTYRRMAEDAVDAAVRRLPAAGASRTRTLPLVGAMAADDTSDRLVRRYGSEAADVARLAAEHPECAGALYDGCAVTGEELLFGVLAEGATSVDDLLQRRVRLGLVPADAERARPAAERIFAIAREIVESGC